MASSAVLKSHEAPHGHGRVHGHGHPAPDGAFLLFPRSGWLWVQGTGTRGAGGPHRQEAG